MSARKPRAKPRHLESQHQRTVIAWAQLHAQKYPKLKMLVAIPNGGARSKVEAAIMKAEGVRAGVHDLFLFTPMGGYFGLSIEMKDEHKPPAAPPKISDEQIRWGRDLQAEGYFSAVCFGCDHAINLLVNYLEGRLTR